MSHELDFYTNEAGERVGAVVLARQSAWHREGTVLPEAPDLDTAIRLGGLGFEVQKVPHYAEVPVPEGEPIRVRSDDSFSVVRLDRMKVIGTVGSVWQPLQNQAAFEPIRYPVEQGLCEIESAGCLREGAQVWMLVRFLTDEIIRRAKVEDAPGLEALLNEILPYALLSNDHSGRAMARVKETGIRVVCANTLDWSLGLNEGFSVEVAHTSDVEQSYRMASDALFVQLVSRFAALANHREVLGSTPLPQPAFNRLVLDRAVPIRHLELKVQRREDSHQTRSALERASEKRDRISTLWTAGKGHTGDLSAWEAYNGLVEWVDHDPQIGGENRVQSLYDGTLGQIKRNVFRSLLDYAVADNDQRMAMVAIQ